MTTPQTPGPSTRCFFDDEDSSVTTKLDLRFGDCLDVLRELPDESVHAVITDPPYGLADHKPERIAQAVTAWTSGDREHVPDGRGFMGRSWDAFVPPPAVWDECLRVLKPGGHLLAFAGSRTADLMGLSVRMAGFEVRDTIMWVYGSGFPKSMDVSKAIDKAAGAEREVVGMKRSGGATALPGHNADAGPTTDAWRESGGFAPGLAPVTAPATPAAEQWQGWGTALKPAQEPIIVARKPLSGTVAANVLEHGTGGINVDACRVQYVSEVDRAQAAVPQPSFGVKADGAGTYNYRAGEGRNGERFEPGAGRWPANVILSHAEVCGDECADGCPVAELDAQSGTLKSGTVKPGTQVKSSGGTTMGKWGERPFTSNVIGDEGGASRFFPVFRYQAKAPARERPKIDGKGWPTVKPLALMRWLVRLVTPPGGTVLDPFAGTGATLQAARDEGFASIGIERDEFAYRLACQRLGLPEVVPMPVADTEPDPVMAAIRRANSDEELIEVYLAHRDAWTDQLAQAAAARRAEFGGTAA